MGAGNGRSKPSLADMSKSVLAFDFIENYCEANAKANSSRSSVEVRCQDVKTFVLPKESCDVVFSNWLLMYLSNGDVALVLSRIMQWLRSGGYFFFWESCGGLSSVSIVKDLGENHTKYREEIDDEMMLEAE